MDKTNIARRYLDFFAEHHCAGPTAPPNLSHLNLVSISDFTGKERNLVVYTIENWIANCKKTKVDTDPVRQPPPDPRARGFLDLAPFELWTTQAGSGKWADSYIVPTLPGLAPYSSLRGGLKHGTGPGARQGKVKVRQQPGAYVRRGPAPANVGPIDVGTGRVVDPFILHNKTRPSHTTLTKDDNGEYILTPVLPQRGPGKPTISLLSDILSGRVEAPPTGTVVRGRLAKAGSHFGIRVPGLAEDDYGSGVDLTKLSATTKKLGNVKPPKAAKSTSKSRSKRKREPSQKSGGEEEDEVDELASPEPKKPRTASPPNASPKAASVPPTAEVDTPPPSAIRKTPGKGKKKALALAQAAQTDLDPPPSTEAGGIESGGESLAGSSLPAHNAAEGENSVRAPAAPEPESMASEPSADAVSSVVQGGVLGAESQPATVEPEAAEEHSIQPMEDAASSLLQLSAPRPDELRSDASPSPAPATPAFKLARSLCEPSIPSFSSVALLDSSLPGFSFPVQPIRPTRRLLDLRGRKVFVRTWCMRSRSGTSRLSPGSRVWAGSSSSASRRRSCSRRTSTSWPRPGMELRTAEQSRRGWTSGRSRWP